ncbi:MAG: hypothetical protein IKF36_03625 [Bacilli bacterium]|nr:hypothetical protein [Bacilli bacterium]
MKKTIITITILLELFLLLYPKEVIIEFRNTINICLYSLTPTMFFSILFSYFISYNLDRNIYSIILISILSGYPNNITDNEYLNYVTNFVNPIFFIGTVGSIYLNNIKFTFIILITHYISNFIMIFLFKNKIKLNYKKSNISITNFYSKSLNNTIKKLVIIVSNLLFISILVTLLKLTLPFNNTINSFILGLLEFSKGIYEINLCDINLFFKGLLILIVITFGSISIHFQIISINNKIKYIKFLKYRILNVFISVIIYFFIMLFYKF